MVDMTSAAMLEFSDMKSIYLVKPESDEEEDRMARLHELEITDSDSEETKNEKRKANAIVRYKKRRYEESKRAKAEKEMMTVEAARDASLYEIKQINQTFEHMASGLQAFSKYVPRDIVLEMLRGGGNTGLGVKPKEITIFFSDIEGFTTICDMMTPNDVLFMLSKYFKVMSNIITKLGGTLLEFIGDAILATWNAPGNVADHASACIEASLQMQEALVSMCGHEDDEIEDITPDMSSYYWRVIRKYPVVKIRCGIHSGRVFVGNLGAPNRMKFGIMGDGVNLASRLEELNKKYATRIIISQNTFEMGATVQGAPADNQEGNYIASQFITRQLDLVQVKGRSRGTAVYEVLGRRMPQPFLGISTEKSEYLDALLTCNWTPVIRSEHTQNFTVSNSKENGPILSQYIKLANTYNSAFAAYLRRDFPQAIKLFTAALAERRELCVIQAKIRKYRRQQREKERSGELEKVAGSRAVVPLGNLLDTVELDPFDVEYTQDLPSQLLIDRCEFFIREPPPAEWDGIEKLKGKDG